MFGFHQYLDKIYKIKWVMLDSEVETLSEKMFVEFEKVNHYFVIKNINYSFVDILLGLEEVEFEFKKTKHDLILKILKI